MASVPVVFEKKPTLKCNRFKETTFIHFDERVGQLPPLFSI